MATGLVEREAEVGVLERSLTASAAGRGGVVVVDAAPGLGKTVLLRHARDLALAAGFRVLSARGAELESDFTFGVVRQLFEPALPRDGVGRARLFTGAAGITESLFHTTDITGLLDDAPERATRSLYPLLNGLYWLLVNLTETAPVAVLVDDAQWVDLPSLQFLGFLARRLDSIAATAVITNRPGEHRDEGILHDILAAEDATLLEPKSLSVSAVAELVRRELGPDTGDEFCAACRATTSGNPLFVRELLRTLATTDVRPGTTAAVASVEAAGPDAIHRHVIARLQRQPQDTQVVARVVAVLGDDTDLALVARLANLSLRVTAGAAERLIQCGIFERRDPPAFLHAVVRDVVLSLIPAAERSAEHERAARMLLAAGAPVERVASHLLRITPSASQERVGILLAAAEQARRRGSPESAAVYLLRAREEPPPPGQRSEISRLLGNCQAYQMAFTDAETHLREALSLATTPAQRAVCAHNLARFRNACGNTSDAVDLLIRATGDVSAKENPALALELEAELIGVARADLHSRALVVERLAAFRPPPGRYLAMAQAHQSMEAMLSGEPASHAVALARMALTDDHLTPERSSLYAALHTLMLADHLDEAGRRLHQVLDIAIERGLLLPIAIIRGYLARVGWLRGDLALAGEHVDRGTEAAPEPHVALPLVHSTAVHLLLEDDQVAQAHTVMESSVLSAGRLARSYWQLWLLDARARLRAAQGSTEAALADALSCGRLYELWGAAPMLELPWRLRAAEALFKLGDPDRAGGLVAEELRLARSFTVGRHIALALRGAAQLATEPAEARRLLAEAVELLGDGPGRLELARTLEALGERYLQDGDRKAGREAIRRAAELALECHATAMAERLRARLGAGGGRPPRLRVSGVHALTPAERQVAELTANALTNRQIAERLFVTEKTVEAHLSRVFRKLGIASRTQLAGHLAALAPSPPAEATT